MLAKLQTYSLLGLDALQRGSGSRCFAQSASQDRAGGAYRKRP